jgi:hypothetical protein
MKNQIGRARAAVNLSIPPPPATLQNLKGRHKTKRDSAFNRLNQGCTEDDLNLPRDHNTLEWIIDERKLTELNRGNSGCSFVRSFSGVSRSGKGPNHTPGQKRLDHTV